MPPKTKRKPITKLGLQRRVADLEAEIQKLAQERDIQEQIIKQYRQQVRDAKTTP